MWATWWVWVVGGFLLGLIEVAVPGYIFLGFATGAVLTGVLILLGVVGGGPAWLILVFAVLSLLAWLGLRRTMGIRRGQVKVWDRDINDN